MRSQFKSIFNLLWEGSSTEFKEYIFHDERRQFEYFVTFQLDWVQGLDMIEILFKDLNTQKRRNIILAEDIVDKYCYFIHRGEWNSVDSFINCIFFLDEDISQMTQRLIQEIGRLMTLNFLRQRKFHLLDGFLNFTFKSETKDC